MDAEAVEGGFEGEPPNEPQGDDLSDDLTDEVGDDHVAHRRNRRLAAVAAVVVLLAVVAAVVIHRNGDSSSHVATSSAPVPRLVPSSMSPQVGLVRVLDLPAATRPTDLPVIRVWLYATGSPTDPLGGSNFAILATRLPGDDGADGGSGGTTPAPLGFVGNMPAQYGTMHGAEFRISQAVTIEVASAQLSDQQLRAIGQTVRVGADGLTVAAVDLPAGYHTVVSDADGVSTAAGAAIDIDAHGYLEGWFGTSGAEEGLPSVYLSALASAPAQLDVIRWGLSDVTQVKVDGHSGYLGSLPGGETMSASSGGRVGSVAPGPRTWVLAWFYDDTTLVTIQASGGLTEPGCSGDCTPQIVERIAASLHPVDDAAWQTFEQDTTTSTYDPPAGCTQSGDRVTCSSSGSSPATVVVVPTTTAVTR